MGGETGEGTSGAQVPGTEELVNSTLCPQRPNLKETGREEREGTEGREGGEEGRRERE